MFRILYFLFPSTMNRILLILLLITSFFATSNAQYNIIQNSVWAAGNQMGLDFRGGGDPVPFSTNMNGIEGCASVTSPTGKFLFYSNGSNVWDSTGAIMPNGNNLPGYASATQGTLIVPVIGDPQKYYLFLLSYQNGYCKLNCKQVNMSLHNGLGDIDPTFSFNNTIFADSLSEKMIAMPGCNKDLWVIVHANTRDNFYAFNISFNGINTTPVVSSFTNAMLYFYGVMKGSPMGNKILICTQGLKTYDFDGSSGRVSNSVMHDFDAYYGGSFSPDGTKIYGLTFGFQSHLYQYDLLAANPSSTKTMLDTASYTVNYSLWADFKLAIDDKIYFPSFNVSQRMGRINNPNLPGLACGFQNVFPGIDFSALSPSTMPYFGLPNEVVVAGQGSYTTVNVLLDTTICNFPYSQGITLTAPAGHNSYKWNDNATNLTRTVHQPGKYWVRYNTEHCNFVVDSFIIKSGLLPLDIINTNNVLSTTETYATYQWYFEGQSIPAANNQQYTAMTAGWYSVKVTNEYGCSDSTGYLVGNVTAIQNIESIRNQITIFPNPTHNSITLKAPLQVKVQLMDINGKKLLESEDKTIDISPFANGLYLLYIKDNKDNLIMVKKVVKN